MADLGTLVAIADKLFQLLQSPILKGIKDWKSDLQNLNKSVSFIRNMLLDVDTKPELSHGEQAWVQELQEVLYDADDLFDEVITIAKHKAFVDVHPNFSKKKLLDKISRFFSSKDCILVSYNTSREVKSIQQKLDDIARDHARYEFKVDRQASKHEFKIDPLATLHRRDDTCSFLDETHENIIGREDDVNAIVDMLLDLNVEENVGFVVIVGIGGLGKTTLARLVYNHNRVKSKFEKNMWVCVSDHDGKELDVKAVLGNIIESATHIKPSAASTMESVQTKLQERLRNKMYLCVLDDVWTEDPNEWSKLRRYLTIGGRGSRVLITTRSERTAEVVLGKATQSIKYSYMLKGLSDEYSWNLFMLTAFERESDHSDVPELIAIGKKIVKKCSNVPLAIKVLGTLLYGQTHKWESFEKNRLPQIETSMNPIMSILKLSYNNLEPFVKNCFKYCAIFPKNLRMSKQKLISLWMAQGYIVDSEDCFLILLKRCFFQDVEKDDLGDIVSFKMHDLIHDLAQEIAGDEFIVADSLPNYLCKKNRHLFINGGEWTKTAFQEINLRTCYMSTWVDLDPDLVITLVDKWRCLRSLCLYVPHAIKLPESIGGLLHLRYLDVSGNDKLETLPNSIVKLYNLQSLFLRKCRSLKEWPKEFYKLVNLRLLDIGKCRELSYMPLGISKLTNLRDLTDFEVGTVSSVGKQLGGELRDLKCLVNLRGKLKITIGENVAATETENVWDGGYLECTKNLKLVEMYFCWNANETHNEAAIAKLQPNQNLTRLCLNRYNGTEIARWGRAQDDWASILPNLVKIELHKCERLQVLPLLSKLKHLKSLFLFELNNLEYMETSLGSKDIPFFSSLVSLSIWGSKRLKGWWGEPGLRGVGEGDRPRWQPQFPRLSKLSISLCPELTSFPPCPSLESLRVSNSNKSLQILPGEGPSNSDLPLRVEEIDSLGYLTTLPATRLTHILISRFKELKTNSEIDEVLKSSSSLRSLEIGSCGIPTSVSGILKHLTALESLSLIGISSLLDDPVNDEIHWKSLHQNLRTLELASIHNLEFLPRGMKHLTALQSLFVRDCESLKALPDWISCLSSLHTLRIMSCHDLKALGSIQNMTSLQKLEIYGCRELRESCEPPSGDEWPNIQHIPHISITDGQSSFFRRPARRDIFRTRSDVWSLPFRGCV